MKRLWAALVLVATGGTAQAGGLFLPARGVRPAGRGGAFVAGADDVGALWYNPAGLGALIDGAQKKQFLFDFALVPHQASYTRVDSGGNPQPTVEAEGQTLPIPTLGAAVDLSPRLALGVGLLSPYAALDEYPQDGAQRYSLVSLHHTTMFLLEAALAYRVSDRLTVGGGLQNLWLTFRSRVVFSGCPGQTVCAPEDPEFDALGEVEQHEYWNPSGILGMQLVLSPKLRLGAALQLPFASRSEGTIRVRLPSSGFFDGAEVVGDRAELSMTLPAMFRIGVEVAPARGVRLEAGVDVETWSLHDEIVIEPKDMRIENAAAVGTYELGPLRIPRQFEDTVALRLGLEARPLSRLPLDLRLGYAYETGAVPDEYLTVLTIDANKHLLAAGASYRAFGVRLDAVFGRVVLADREVEPGKSCAPQLNPIRSGEDPSSAMDCIHDGDPSRVYVGDGTYQSSYTLLGLGAALDF